MEVELNVTAAETRALERRLAAAVAAAALAEDEAATCVEVCAMLSRPPFAVVLFQYA